MNTDQLSEVFLSDTRISYKIKRLQQQGKIRLIVGKLYTSNLIDDINQIIHRRLWEIIGLLFPNSLIADRSAFDLKPTKNKEIFIISPKQRSIKIGDYTIYPRKGAEIQPSDTPFMEKLYLPSTARKFLENMRISRHQSSQESRYLSQAEIEEKLDAYIRSNGEKALNTLRDEMKRLAPILNLTNEYHKINGIIGSMLQTHHVVLQSETALARSHGEAFDPNRVMLFTKLYEDLSNRAPVFRKTTHNNSSVLCFYEAYFSNYIEGTKFPIDEAVEIVFDNKIPEDRPEDAHDISGTYEIVSNMNEMMKTPKTFEELIYILKYRHKVLMGGRPLKYPGEFKRRANQAGSTVFTAPDLIMGTLKKGFELYQKLDNAFNKAVFMMFMITEVHPFDDGNGRLSRIMMNAELIADSEQRIIIPTVYRGNYLMSLKGLSHNGITDAFIKTIDFAQKYTYAIDWENLKISGDMLKATNAFTENTEDETAILKLPANIK